MGHNSVFVNKVVCALHFPKAPVGENRKNPRKKESELRNADLRNDWALKISGTGCLVGQLVCWDKMSRHQFVPVPEHSTHAVSHGSHVAASVSKNPSAHRTRPSPSCTTTHLWDFPRTWCPVANGAVSSQGRAPRDRPGTRHRRSPARRVAHFERTCFTNWRIANCSGFHEMRKE